MTPKYAPPIVTDIITSSGLIIKESPIILGFIIMVVTIAKNRKNIKMIEFDRVNLNKYKYLFFDYTFIITVVVTGLLFTATEKFLKM